MSVERRCTRRLRRLPDPAAAFIPFATQLADFPVLQRLSMGLTLACTVFAVVYLAIQAAPPDPPRNILEDICRMPHFEVTLVRHVPEHQVRKVEADTPAEAIAQAEQDADADPCSWEFAKGTGEAEPDTICRTDANGRHIEKLDVAAIRPGARSCTT